MSKFTKFIILGAKKYCGYWGQGTTLDEAKKQYKKAGGTTKGITAIYQFTSDKPFAPSNREATADESDAYMDKGGGLNWIRCERKEIDGK